MRDPEASITLEERRAVRQLRMPLPADHFLYSELARQWVERGDLIRYEVLSDRVVESPRLPFVSHPYEWCDGQVHAAADLTLRLQQEATDAGFDLKDASAWNVVFDGTRPLFCDLLSFQRLRYKKWWAAGQFARHFIFPLLLSRTRGLRAHECFAIWRDGVPESSMRELVGFSRFLGRYWPLMTSVQASEAKLAGEASTFLKSPDEASGFRRSLHGGLSWMLKGVIPAESQRQTTYWQDYDHERSHYDGASLDGKRVVVKRWLECCKPQWVLDLGCNSGEFSLLATAVGAQVIAVDADHGAMQRLWRRVDPSIHPVVAKLDDLSGGRGWSGMEHTGLVARLEERVDMAMMLAVIHHLAIDASIPLEHVARFARRCTRRWLIVEFLTLDDVQLQSLCLRRRREPAEFSLGRQRLAFAQAGFDLTEEVPLPSGTRSLALLVCRD